MITLHAAQRYLIYATVLFGPLGSLLSPSFLPYAFRFYYFFLLIFPLFFINLQKYQWQATLAFIPFLSYCLISAYFTHNKEIASDAHPLFRSLLLVSQCLFMFGAAFALSKRDQEKEKKRLIYLYLIGFFLSLLVGYIFFIGYYSHTISFSTIQKYSVEAQMGWGLLRFSPGSYANEYGNVASFALSILLLLYAQKKKFWLLCFIPLTFLALLLTTTRAAYFSFFITLVYLSLTQKIVRRRLIKFFIFALALLFILKAYSIDFFKIFIAAFKTISLTSGSTGTRVSTWLEALQELNTNILFGNGFGANMQVHNVYSILLFELGLIGCLILIITLIYHFSNNSLRIQTLFSSRTFSSQIVIIGLIHITLFALTNHNMHHHLTWFVLLLSNSSYAKRDFGAPQQSDSFLNLG